ncbi:MAG: hypothetical protein ABSH44_25505 [Bryobacteraceae bacterium]|jgi:hypothetical protein
MTPLRRIPELILLAALPVVTALAQQAPRPFVRSWVVKPPRKPGAESQTPALHTPFLKAVPVRRAGQVVHFPIVITPCTSFPGNPVFVIEGDKVTMIKGSIR